MEAETVSDFVLLLFCFSVYFCRRIGRGSFAFIGLYRMSTTRLLINIWCYVLSRALFVYVLPFIGRTLQQRKYDVFILMQSVSVLCKTPAAYHLLPATGLEQSEQVECLEHDIA